MGIFDQMPKIHKYAQEGNLEGAMKEIRKGVNVNKIYMLKSPLHLASYYGHVEIVKQLIRAGADVNAKDNFNYNYTSYNYRSYICGSTPLHEAKNADVVKELLKSGADVDAKDYNGKTPLHGARESDIVKELIKYGANVNAKDHEGITPLMEARKADIIKELIKSGADINAKDYEGNTLLHEARYTEAGVVKELIKSGADVNAKNNNGSTPLHFADANMVKQLIKCGADVNAKNDNGMTPLHCAENARVVTELIRAGADISARNKYGNTVFEIFYNKSELSGILGTLFIEMSNQINSYKDEKAVPTNKTINTESISENNNKETTNKSLPKLTTKIQKKDTSQKLISTTQKSAELSQSPQDISQKNENKNENKKEDIVEEKTKEIRDVPKSVGIRKKVGYRKMIEECNVAINNDKTDFKQYIKKGMIYERIGNYFDAYISFRNADRYENQNALNSYRKNFRTIEFNSRLYKKFKNTEKYDEIKFFLDYANDFYRFEQALINDRRHIKHDLKIEKNTADIDINKKDIKQIVGIVEDDIERKKEVKIIEKLDLTDYYKRLRGALNIYFTNAAVESNNRVVLNTDSLLSYGIGIAGKLVPFVGESGVKSVPSSVIRLFNNYSIRKNTKEAWEQIDSLATASKLMDYVARKVTLQHQGFLKNNKVSQKLVADIVAAEIILYVESYKASIHIPLAINMIQGAIKMDVKELLSKNNEDFLFKIRNMAHRVPTFFSKNYRPKNSSPSYGIEK